MILMARTGVRALPARLALRTVQAVRRVLARVTHPRSYGSRAICLTRDEQIILVRHSYTQGWYLPGGGHKRDEASAPALLRELHEEIGVSAHGAVERLFTIEHRPNGWRDQQSVLTVRDIEFAPRLSLEIEAIGVFSPDALPADLHPSTAYRIGHWRAGTQGVLTDSPPEA